MIRIVLHERGAPLKPGSHDLYCTNQRGMLPVALGPESVPCGHQALHGQARKLGKAMQILKGIRKGRVAGGLQKMPEPELNPRRGAD